MPQVWATASCSQNSVGRAIVNKPLARQYFWGGVACFAGGGGVYRLTSHDNHSWLVGLHSLVDKICLPKVKPYDVIP